MPVITFLNRKGGVGKTACCHNLSAALAQMGRKVLMIDNDPQASLTRGILGAKEAMAIPPEASIASIFAGDEPFPGQVIRTVTPGLDLIPGSDDAEGYDLPHPTKTSAAAQCCLREFLSEVRDRYEYILIDCIPVIRACSWAALVAADKVIIPLHAEDHAVQGVSTMLDAVDLARESLNPTLSLAGLLITMHFPRKSLHKVYAQMLRNIYGDQVFATEIPHAVEFPESVSARKSVVEYKPRGAAAKAIRAVAEELEARLAVRSAA